MEIRDLNYFRTVIEAGGVTKAAGVLHMTPGALSKALKRFEDDLGHRVLKRAGRKLVMTTVGERLYERSARLLDEHTSLLRELDATAGGGATRLRIASMEVFTSAFMSEFINEHLPNTEVEIIDVLVGDIESAVLEKRADFGLTYVPHPSDELSFRRLGRFERGVFGLRGAFKSMSVSEVPFTVPLNRAVQLPSGEQIGIDGWPFMRHARTETYRSTTLQFALENAQRGLSIAVLPNFVVALHNETAKRSCQLEQWPSPAGLGQLFLYPHLICRHDERDEPQTKEIATMLKKTLTRVCSKRVPMRTSPSSD
jgi:DNA-binding transcriptional LysR family regulator